MGSAKTLAQAREEIYLLIDEPVGSDIGTLAQIADDDTIVLTTAQTMAIYLNRAAQNVARSCYFYNVSGTMSIVSGTSQYFATGATLNSPDAASTMWAVRTLAWVNGANPPVTLPWIKYAKAEQRMVYDPRATGAPQFWYHPMEDVEQFALYPTPNANNTVNVTGFAVPAPMVDGTDDDNAVFSWLPFDDLVLIALYDAAMQLCREAAEDQKVLSRLAAIEAKYNIERAGAQARLDPAMLKRYMKILPPPPYRGRPVRAQFLE